MLAAGLDGIKNKLEPPAPVEENIYHISSTRQRRTGIQVLPRNLEEAVRLAEKSQLVRETLGDQLFQ